MFFLHFHTLISTEAEKGETLSNHALTPLHESLDRDTLSTTQYKPSSSTFVNLQHTGMVSPTQDQCSRMPRQWGDLRSVLLWKCSIFPCQDVNRLTPIQKALWPNIKLLEIIIRILWWTFTYLWYIFASKTSLWLLFPLISRLSIHNKTRKDKCLFHLNIVKTMEFKFCMILFLYPQLSELKNHINDVHARPKAEENTINSIIQTRFPLWMKEMEAGHGYRGDGTH